LVAGTIGIAGLSTDGRCKSDSGPRNIARTAARITNEAAILIEGAEYWGLLPTSYPTDYQKKRRTSHHRQEVRPVRKSRYSDEQIAAALRQAEIGTPVAEITRKLGISEATFYVWKKRFGSLGTPEIRELRQLREENAKLKMVVADLTLDRAVLQDVIKKKW
jgi:putative transposase